MATARRTGTNEQVTTYGDGTRTYTALATWEAATDTDHVADNETDVLECYDDAASFDDSVDMSGSTNDATRFRIIRPASGQGHDGTSNNGVFFDLTSNVSMFRLNETFCQIQDLILQQSLNSTSFRNTVLPDTGDVTMIGIIAFDSFNSGAGRTYDFRPNSIGTSTSLIMVLCLSDNSEQHGFLSQPGSGNTVRAYNCIAISPEDDGFSYVSGTFTLTNCLATGSGAGGEDFEAAGTFANSDFCAAGDTSDPGAGGSNRVSQTFTFVNEAGNDFHLTTADTGAKDFGTDLSADATFDFDDDINDGTMGAAKSGELFSTWDIGFDEPGDAAAGLPTLALMGVGF